MIIKINKFFKGFGGIALFPFIFILRSVYSEAKVRHEKIHICQQIGLLVIPFYLLYIGFFLFYLAKYKNRWDAYYAIPFEKEALSNQDNPAYQRKLYAWLKYMKNDNKRN